MSPGRIKGRGKGAVAPGGRGGQIFKGDKKGR